MMKKVINFLFVFIFILFLPNNIYSQNSEYISSPLKDVTIYDIASDQNGIWLASYGKGIYFVDKNSGVIENYSTQNGKLQHDMFYCIAVSNRYVWAGSVDGLFIFDKNTKRWSKRKFGRSSRVAYEYDTQLSNWIRSLKYDDSDNVLWIGRFMFLTKLNVNTQQYTDYDLTIKGNFKTNNIKSIGIDGDSLVWFGTEGGLHRYNKSLRFENPNSTFFYDNSKNYFNGEGKTVSITDILFEQDNIWVGLDEFKVAGNEDYNLGGLFRYNRKNEWIRFDINNGLSGNGVFSIEKTGNFIWVSTYQYGMTTNEAFGRGLVLINRASLAALPITDPNIPSTIHKIHFDGKNLWLGTNQGLTKIVLINNFAKWD